MFVWWSSVCEVHSCLTHWCAVGAVNAEIFGVVIFSVRRGLRISVVRNFLFAQCSRQILVTLLVVVVHTRLWFNFTRQSNALVPPILDSPPVSTDPPNKCYNIPKIFIKKNWKQQSSWAIEWQNPTPSYSRLFSQTPFGSIWPGLEIFSLLSAARYNVLCP